LTIFTTNPELENEYNDITLKINKISEKISNFQNDDDLLKTLLVDIQYKIDYFTVKILGKSKVKNNLKESLKVLYNNKLYLSKEIYNFCKVCEFYTITYLNELPKNKGTPVEEDKKNEIINLQKKATAYLQTTDDYGADPIYLTQINTFIKCNEFYEMSIFYDFQKVSKFSQMEWFYQFLKNGNTLLEHQLSELGTKDGLSFMNQNS
jgi:hypothetical protein